MKSISSDFITLHGLLFHSNSRRYIFQFNFCSEYGLDNFKTECSAEQLTTRVGEMTLYTSSSATSNYRSPKALSFAHDNSQISHYRFLGWR